MLRIHAKSGFFSEEKKGELLQHSSKRVYWGASNSADWVYGLYVPQERR